ncbi:tellurite resistance/C4-dicarboxylate transporter family protein [Algiphilus aromaticivorans]|uniref:tellurite resistance/C4-dicarboxylate transporter family protein n=1 Tax=Algiphilus aromaticivorans TaxID=382454 RepID=UPI0005C1CFAD|nr:tellurite resistance/C4-dicarboxylate transporter family protein [Algiphilus aromaticivorans]
MPKALARRAGALLDQGAAQLFPGYFSVVMATGATSIAAHLLGYALLAQLLLLANVLAYVILWGFTLTRLLRYPRRLVGDMVDHARGPGFFTIIAATSILGSQLVLLRDWAAGGAAFWWLASGLWLLIMYAFFIAVTIRSRKPTLASGINGAWLLAAVSTQSVSVLTSLVPWSGGDELRLFFALAMYLVGCMLYMAIITLIFYRLTFLRLTADTLTPPYWINMGAVAIATLAGATLILQTGDSALLTELLPFLKSFTLFFWATATWWVHFLIGLTLWRHVLQRHALRYEPQLWSMVFPLAMYTTGTLRLSAALELDFLAIIPAITFWLALAAWMLTSAGMAGHFGRITWRALLLRTEAPT